MDRLKGVAKGGWHPSRDTLPIHRDSWKTDLKGIATGKKKDPYEEARSHQSTPLTTLRDPDTFGPPPKHTGYGGSASSGNGEASAHDGNGLPVPVSSRRQQQEAEEEVPKPPPEPYRKDTTGLRTDHLPKPPVRRVEAVPASPARTSSPSLPPRQTPASPVRQATKPPPILPPRQNENPHESTPPPPPSYGEAINRSDPAEINEGAANRLARAGVSVAGFGIGQQYAPAQSPSATPQRGPQLSELQQRFSRMNTGGQVEPPSSSSSQLAAAKKAPPPPPPPKRIGLGGGNGSRPTSSAGSLEPPPLPLSSKPWPPG
ncbi:hypothetical protein LTR02_007188 [Friedmanniomyces endolithicus]|nr:hypothetical protein LTR94_019476 [Friedmanniomyces endolithicus]KAK0774438.1 hypothetical protein LTR59_014877 [Friedmanniomyces endolithicus]KAK0802625.1 hypothetical protein LTR75_008196 [Friedmanniomyces endolithicus]KAK0834121.1 hypothetical protein LTR03_014584 [Friedmanniomyces endolithicus]KAK0849412.1 hypothetical protein LTS02_013621 [Friedmanniomyces endolithicus]